MTSPIITALQGGSDSVASGATEISRIIPLLHESARTKLEALIERRDAFRAELRRAGDARLELWTEHAQMVYRVQERAKLYRFTDLTEQEHDVWRRNTKDMGFKAARDEYNRIVAEKARMNERTAGEDAAKLADLQQQLDRASEAHAAAQARYDGLACLVPCCTWLSRVIARGGTVVPVAPPPVTIKGAYADAVADIRARIAAINEQTSAAETRHAPPDEIKARIRAEVEEFASKGAPTLDPTDRRPQPLGVDKLLTVRLGVYPAGDTLVVPNLNGNETVAHFMAWMLQDAIVERASALVDALPIENPLSDAERRKKLSALADQKLALEREEEATVCGAEGFGQFLARRLDADPRAILEVQEAA